MGRVRRGSDRRGLAVAVCVLLVFLAGCGGGGSAGGGTAVPSVTTSTLKLVLATSVDTASGAVRAARSLIATYRIAVLDPITGANLVGPRTFARSRAAAPCRTTSPDICARVANEAAMPRRATNQLFSAP